MQDLQMIPLTGGSFPFRKTSILFLNGYAIIPLSALPEVRLQETMTDEIEKSALGHVAPKKRKVKLSLPKTAMSLKPGMQLMDLLLLPNKTERVLAIQDAWKFRFPVTQAEKPVETTPQVIFASTRWNEGVTTRRANYGNIPEPE